MKASISSESNRTAGNVILFDVPVDRYDAEKSRTVTKKTTLNGTVLTTNWGAPEGNRRIQINNVLLSQDNYDVLIGMMEDDNYDFLYSYLNSTWKVVINSVIGTWNGKKMLTNIFLSVIEKYEDGETS